MQNFKSKNEYLADIESTINALSEPLFTCYKHIVLYNITTNGTNYAKNSIVNFSSLTLACDNNNNSASISSDLSFSIKTNNNCVLSDDKGVKTISKESACEIISKLFSHELPLFVTYNAQLSMCFINKFFELNGVVNIFNSTDILDLLSIYRDRNGFPCKINHALSKYNLIAKNTNNELKAVSSLYELLKALMKERDDLAKYVNIFGYVTGEPMSKFDNVTYVRFKNNDNYTRLYERVSI
ncbi:MAG: hypothetical protein FWC20_00660 [Oscillospiraceae bacterium]|nr:hypothetical protein [Oscillospiraceae bacterium]MCL2277904.1 hypothetical protein [Oscillospiraceae bacterium]